MTRRKPTIWIGLALLGLLVWLVWRGWRTVADPRSSDFLTWMRGDAAERAALIIAERAPCPGAPFILPSDGWIGLLYADPRGPYTAARPHQGIDIFSDAAPGVVPVYAAYDGYIRREENWVSTLIQRVPDDPLQPGRQIWLYYTHMADRDGRSFVEPAFPPGAREVWVAQGTLLGYTGDYNGNAARAVWVHLHFSIVQDNGRGGYLNELAFENTVDPSPYLGLDVRHDTAPPGPASCRSAEAGG